MEIEKLTLKTEDLISENVEKLGELFPEILTETEKDGKIIKTINFEKLKELVGDYADKNSEIYELTWAGKQNARRVATESTTNTLRPVIEDSVNFENTENLYIEGDNLEVLKILRKSYSNSIKCIYIDPPYNTGKDFVYSDNFSMDKKDYESEAGVIDDEGNKLIKNTGTDGRFHSNWLNMMYPRLQLAYKLLKKDGVIFISIDDNEVDNLRKICDEIFGENNRLDRGSFIWLNKGSTKGFNKIVKNHEYILAYAKNAEEVESVYGINNPENLGIIEERLQIKRSSKNPLSQVKFPKGLKIEGVNDIVFENQVGNGTNIIDIVEGKLEFKDGILINDVILEASFPYKNQMTDFFSKIGTDKKTFDYKGQEWVEVFFTKTGVPYFRKKRGFVIPSSILDNVSNSGYNDLKKIGMEDAFTNPKPVSLLKIFIDYFTKEGDIIMDFFAGSSTFVDASMQLSIKNPRKYIAVQFPEDLDEAVKTADGDNKTTLENSIKFLDSIKKPHLLTEIGKERIRRAAKKIQEENKDRDLSNVDFGFRVFKLDSSNMKDTYYSPENITQTTLINYKDTIKEDRNEEDLIYQVLLDMGIPISAKIEINTIQNKKVFVINSGWLVGCFDENINLELVKELAEIKSDIEGLKPKFVFRESSFKNDSEMINSMEYLKIKLFKTDPELKANVKVI